MLYVTRMTCFAHPFAAQQAHVITSTLILQEDSCTLKLCSQFKLDSDLEHAPLVLTDPTKHHGDIFLRWTYHQGSPLTSFALMSVRAPAAGPAKTVGGYCGGQCCVSQSCSYNGTSYYCPTTT